MSNAFLEDYYTRLHLWSTLKENLKGKSTEEICIEVDKFWQQAPLLNHYLHPADVQEWPNPWQLLSDNDYCEYARGLGMVYTLLLLDINNIDFVQVLDENNEDKVIVVVDQYVMNWHPNSVISAKKETFKIGSFLDITELEKKIGKE